MIKQIIAKTPIKVIRYFHPSKYSVNAETIFYNFLFSKSVNTTFEILTHWDLTNFFSRFTEIWIWFLRFHLTNFLQNSDFWISVICFDAFALLTNGVGRCQLSSDQLWLSVQPVDLWSLFRKYTFLVFLKISSIKGSLDQHWKIMFEK